MRYFYDCEFIEDGKTIDLISIGIVAEDGRELYLQSVEFDPYHSNDWVRQNVVPYLKQCPHIQREASDSPMLELLWQLRKHPAHPGQWTDRLLVGGQCAFEDAEKGIVGTYAECPWRDRAHIKLEILAFMDIEKYGKPELWGYYSAYDHVAFCQLFGTMMDLPKGYPMYTRDIKQWCDALGNPRLPEQDKGEHNALADARWNKQAWEFLKGLEP